MKITIRLFASAREVVGASELTWEVNEGTTVGALLEDLRQSYPKLSALRLKTAVNATYAERNTVLRAGDEVACIPPVGGG